MFDANPKLTTLSNASFADKNQIKSHPIIKLFMGIEVELIKKEMYLLLKEGF